MPKLSSTDGKHYSKDLSGETLPGNGLISPCKHTTTPGQQKPEITHFVKVCWQVWELCT